MVRDADSGGLSANERIMRIERELDAMRKIGDARSREMWKKLTELEIQITRNDTRLLLIFLVLSTAAQLAIKRFF